MTRPRRAGCIIAVVANTKQTRAYTNSLNATALNTCNINTAVWNNDKHTSNQALNTRNQSLNTHNRSLNTRNTTYTHIDDGACDNACNIYILHVKQNGSPGYYGFPKGECNPHETVEEAAARETREEVGVVVDTKFLTDENKTTCQHHTYYILLLSYFPQITYDHNELCHASFIDINDFSNEKYPRSKHTKTAFAGAKKYLMEKIYNASIHPIRYIVRTKYTHMYILNTSDSGYRLLTSDSTALLTIDSEDELAGESSHMICTDLSGWNHRNFNKYLKNFTYIDYAYRWLLKEINGEHYVIVLVNDNVVCDLDVTHKLVNDMTFRYAL